MQSLQALHDAFLRWIGELPGVGPFLVIYFTVFLAELGDKTQISAAGFGASSGRWLAFFAGSAALVTSTYFATWFGAKVFARFTPEQVKTFAGLLFIAVGAWTLIKK